ncbi:MAG: hypothetical protein ACREMV_09805 [Gemmatimonadales bacterium]
MTEPAPTHPTGTAVFSTPLAHGPWGVAISSQGLSYVTRPLTDSIARVDLDGPRVTASFRVGNRPDDVWFNASGSTAYVTNLNDGTVGVINTATSTQTATFPVSGGPLRGILGPGETRLYVTLDNGSVVVLNAATGAFDTTLAVGGLPNGIALSPGRSRLYVSSASGTVAEINTATNAILRTLTVGGTPQDIEVSADGNTLYIANEAGWLDVRDIASGARTDSIPVPAAFALAVTPDAAQIWITQSAMGSITVVDRASRAVAKTIQTLGTPRHIAFTRGGRVALIANEQGLVQVIE